MDADTDSDSVGDGPECSPLPHPADPFEPIETATGYDHRAGTGTDWGVIHHEAYLVAGPDVWTMLSLQDFRGEAGARTPGTQYDLADPYSATDAPNYLDCELCVLYLENCPFDSLGGCERQFLAVGGTVRFDEFEKSDSWSVDGLERLGATIENLMFEEVEIDPVTFASEAACPWRSCIGTRDSPDPQCFSVPYYSFSWTNPE